MSVDLDLLNANSITNINTNFTRVQAAFQDSLSRSGNLPNHMNADLDMNSNDILNVDKIQTSTLIVNGEVIVPSGVLSIPPNSIGTDQLIDGSVTIDKLDPGIIFEPSDGDKVDVVVSNNGLNWEVKRATVEEAIDGVSEDSFITPFTMDKAIDDRIQNLPSSTTASVNNIPIRKIYPTAVTSEGLAYSSPTVQRWEDGSGTAKMTKAFFQSRFDDMKEAGITDYIEMYVEYRGSWFYRPTFAYPYDYDTAQTGQFWHDKLTTPHDVNYEDFDFVEAALEKCDTLGIGVWFGLSRQGDTPLAQDLYDFNVLGQPDPMRYGLSIFTRLSNATTRTLQLADDLFTRYGSHSSFVGFKLGHESAHIPSGNNYYTTVNVTGAGGYNPLNWYRDNHNIRSMIVPAKLLEGAIDITSSTYAQSLVNSGADVFTWQNAAGPGLNYQSSDYTWLSRTTYSFTPTDNRQKYSNRIRRLIQTANGFSRVSGRRIENWSIGEVWRMGVRPNATLSIGAGFGTPGTTNVTFTSTGSFSGITVGSVITTIAGKATVTSVAGAPNSVVATINTAFEANSFAADTTDPKWAWSKGYILPYAALPQEYRFEMPLELSSFERTAMYAWNFVSNPNAVLKPPISFNDRSDYRSRMENLYTTMVQYKGEMLKRVEGWSSTIFVDRLVREVTGLSGASINQQMAVYAPKLPGTYARIRLVFNFGKAPSPVQTGAAGNLTVSLVVNGVALVTRTIYDNDGWMGGSVELLLPEWYLTSGTDQTFAVTATSTALGLSGSNSAVIEIEEFMRP